MREKANNEWVAWNVLAELPATFAKLQFNIKLA